MARKQILVVSPNHDVLDPSTGTGARLNRLAAGLAARDNAVSVLLPSEYADANSSAEWPDAVYGFRQTAVHYLTDLNPWFAARLGGLLREREFDVIHVAQPKGVCTARTICTLADTSARVVYGSQLFVTRLADDVNESLPAYKRYTAPYVIPYIERAAVACADYMTTVSADDERDYVEHFGVDPGRIRAVPSGGELVDTAALPSPGEVRRRYGVDEDAVLAVFHGNYEHPPNAGGVEAIRERIAPALADRDPPVEFLLVGNEMPATQAANVHAVGFVEDLFSVLHAADIAVVPVTTGGGTKTKIFDYMSVGLPLVVSAHSTRGIELEDGEHALVREGDGEAFADAVAALAADPDRRRELGTGMRKLAETTYNWDQSAATLDAFFDRVAAVAGADGDAAAPGADTSPEGR